ncbi:sedoheptulokinase isoform X2 [Denticeps clupeoides]|nr:sedoheptulokinase isoform X2 [Denticeps clupeoides]
MSSLPREKLRNVVCVGVSGQMHGIMLWRAMAGCEWYGADAGRMFRPKDVSQLITWQDGRCSDDFLSALPQPDSHISLATGFGCTTIFWLLRHQPAYLQQFGVAGTIHDYVVSMLCGLENCVMSVQNAAGWGYFNTVTGRWNLDILRPAAFPLHLLPEPVDAGALAGRTFSVWHGIPAGTPVGAALGDFQCSVYSCMSSRDDAVLNVSTSAQLTFAMPPDFTPGSVPDARSAVSYFPYFDGSYLAVAAALNGGNAVAAFVGMLNEWMKEFGLELSESSIYSRLIQSALQQSSTDLRVTPTILGERHDSARLGLVCNISPANLSLGHVTRALCRGILDNVAAMMPAHMLQEVGVKRIVGSGSALSRNEVLRQEVERAFPLPVVYGRDVDSAVGVAMVFNDRI